MSYSIYEKEYFENVISVDKYFNSILRVYNFLIQEQQNEDLRREYKEMRIVLLQVLGPLGQLVQLNTTVSLNTFYKKIA